MNRFNNKLYYKPPPVKISKKLQNQQQPEWNSYQTDLNKYKLSNAEAIKKKINSVSKNLESAKKEYQNMILTGKVYTDDFQNDYYDPQNKRKIIRKKIDLTPMNRFEKKVIEVPNKANLMKGNYNIDNNKYTNKRSKSGIYRKTNQNSDIQNLYNINQINNKNKKNDSDDEEIKMVYNSNVNMTIAETKAKNNPLSYLNENNNYSHFNHPELFQEFDQTIQKMQDAIYENKNENIQDKNNINNKNNNKTPQTAQIQKNKKKLEQKIDNPIKGVINKDINNDIPTFDLDDENVNLDNVNDIEKNINKNFSKLNDLDQYMKKLDMMIDDSKKKSMNSQYHKDIINNNDDDFNDDDFNQNNNYKSNKNTNFNSNQNKNSKNKNNNINNKKDMNLPLKDEPQIIQVNQDLNNNQCFNDNQYLNDKYKFDYDENYNNPIEINPNPEIIDEKGDFEDNNNVNFARSFGKDNIYDESNNPYINKFDDQNIQYNSNNNYNNYKYNNNIIEKFEEQNNEVNNFNNQNTQNNNKNISNDYNNINFARSYGEEENYNFNNENMINNNIPQPTKEVKKYSSPIYNNKVDIPNSYTSNNKTYINVQENRNVFNNDNILSNKTDIYNNIPLYKLPNKQFNQNSNIPLYHKQNNEQINNSNINNQNNNFSYITNLLSQTKEEIERLTQDIDQPSINIYKYNNNMNNNF